MATDHDPLGRALDELRRDVADAPLASPAQVRARGDRRTRRSRTAVGAGAVATVAAIAIAGSTLPGVLGRDGASRPAPPAATSTPTPTPTVSASGSPSPTRSVPGPRPVVDVTPVGVGQVPAAYFLPGNLWTGPDLVNGAKIHSIEPKEFEGSVHRFTCDPDTALTGDVAFVQAARADGTIAGTQKVRLLDDPAEATSLTDKLTGVLLSCQDRLRQQAQKDAANLPPGETAPTPTAAVSEDPSARVEDTTGSVRLYKSASDYGTGAGSRLIEWIALVREGSAMSLISINEFEEGDVSFAALRRIANEARAQLAWAAARS